MFQRIATNNYNYNLYLSSLHDNQLNRYYQGRNVQCKLSNKSDYDHTTPTHIGRHF